MAELPRYRDGHAVVAAIRVFESRAGRPPAAEEIAELLQWHPDKTRVVIRGLLELGALRDFESPYDVRYEVMDHLALEKLSDDEKGPGFADELAEFEKEKAQEQSELERVFEEDGPDAATQRRVGSLDNQFAEFRKSQKKNPFGS